MDLLEQINAWAAEIRGPRFLFVAALATLAMFVLMRRREEFSRHAIQNIAATIMVYVMNIGATLLFMADLKRLSHEGYAALNIPTLPADFWQGPWVIVGMILAIVMKDFCDYVSHRIMHTRLGWPSHAAHHSDTDVNAFTTFRVHTFEAFLMSLTYLVILTWMQLPELLPILIVLHICHNIYVHLNLDWDHGPLKYLIASPRFHRWHHADVPEAHGKNLANLIPAYDVFFGTYYVPGPCRAPMGALKSGIDDKNPVRIWLYPFQAWGGMLWQALRGRRDATPAERPVSPAE